MTTEELYKAFGDHFNGAGAADAREFAELMLRDHRTLQQISFGVIMNCIQQFAKAYDAGNFDARNEFSCKKSKEIITEIQDMCISRAPFI